MKELLQHAIELMRSHVLNNLEKVKENEAEINEMMKDPVTPDLSKILAEKYDYSKKVLSENNDFINMQLSLINFVYKYKSVLNPFEPFAEEEKAEEPVLTRDECLQHTLESKMEYNIAHPFFKDDSFLNELLEYYKDIEDYEKCDSLLKIRKHQG